MTDPIAICNCIQCPILTQYQTTQMISLDYASTFELGPFSANTNSSQNNRFIQIQVKIATTLQYRYRSDISVPIINMYRYWYRFFLVDRYRALEKSLFWFTGIWAVWRRPRIFCCVSPLYFLSISLSLSLSLVSCLLSLVSCLCLLSLVSCLLSLVSCLLSLVSCLVSLVSCLLSLVSCLLSLPPENPYPCPSTLALTLTLCPDPDPDPEPEPDHDPILTLTLTHTPYH